ncbi:MAG: DUF445 domain-containing protein [Rhodospirillales bacterium]|nr:DUF445 domain-containing protein [Rhodospirillales bacterium]
MLDEPETRDDEANDDKSTGRQRLVATGLLLAAASLFAATFLDPAPDFWTLLLRHVTEASLAGGIADWFAVVALFRRPLGLPIPHTAVIPRNKERIARGLARFVERHFLDPTTIAERLRGADLSGQAAHWLAEPANAAVVADRATQVLAAVVVSIPDAELRTFVRRAALRGISSLDLSYLVAMAVKAIYDSGRHQEAFDAVVARLRGVLTDDPDWVRRAVKENSAWWVPKAIDRGLTKAAVDYGPRLLDELTAPGSRARRAFDALIVRLIEDLRTSPRYRDEIAGIARDMLAAPRLHEILEGTAENLRHLVLENIAEPDSSIRDAIATAVAAFGRRLCDDDAMRRRLERRIVWLVRAIALPWRHRIGGFFADVMRGWEAHAVAERLEAVVGRDLQYVRINGTIVGGLVGGALFLLTHAFG